MDHVLYFVANPSRAALDAARERPRPHRPAGLGPAPAARSTSPSSRARPAPWPSSAAGARTRWCIDARGESGGVEESTCLCAPARALRRARLARRAQPRQGVAGRRRRRRAAPRWPSRRAGSHLGGVISPRRPRARPLGGDLGAHRARRPPRRPRRQDRPLPRRRRHRGPALRARRAAGAPAVPPRRTVSEDVDIICGISAGADPRRPASPTASAPRRSTPACRARTSADRAHPPLAISSTPTSASSRRRAARLSLGRRCGASAARSRPSSACRPRASSRATGSRRWLERQFTRPA